jgi:hypothetical protein
MHQDRVAPSPARLSRRALIRGVGLLVASGALLSLASTAGGCMGRRGRGVGSLYRAGRRATRDQYVVEPMPEVFFKEMDTHWANWLKFTKRLNVNNNPERNPEAIDAFIKASKRGGDALSRIMPEDAIDAAGTAMGTGLVHRSSMKWALLTSRRTDESWYCVCDKGEKVFVSPWSLCDAVYNDQADETILATTQAIEQAIGSRDYTFFPEG